MVNAYQDWHREHLRFPEFPLMQISIMNVTYGRVRELTVHRDPCALCAAAAIALIYVGQDFIKARNDAGRGETSTDRPI